MKNPRYGKYRARVVDLNDPEKRGRIRVECPLVMGEAKSPWCEVCSPVAYENGGDFCMPKIGDTVWVEFEEGDSERPVWVGNWWSVEHTPLEDYSKAPTMRIVEYDECRTEMEKDKMITTCAECSVELDKKGILLSFKDSSINIGSESISIVCGSTRVLIDKSGNVSINDNLKASGKADINGATNIGGSLSVKGSSSLSDTNVNGTLTAGGINMNNHTHHVSSGEVDTDTSKPQ